jgi:hypothetical protein
MVGKTGRFMVQQYEEEPIGENKTFVGTIFDKYTYEGDDYYVVAIAMDENRNKVVKHVKCIYLTRIL